jgi:DHA2 family multidrug resistance protein
VALAATLLSRRSQYHQTMLVGHVNVWSVDTAARLKEWSDHFVREGGDAFTAQSRALAMIYRDTVGQAQVLAYADEFWLLSMMFFAITLLVPLMRRIRAEPLVVEARRPERVERLEELRPTRASP